MSNLNHVEDALIERLRTPTPEMYELATHTAEETWKNVDMLQCDAGYDKLSRYVYDWAIVLTVLSIDVFESVSLLVQAQRFRAVNILIRSLIEYSVRLRYYVVQSNSARAAFKQDPEIPFDEIKKRVHAAIDWDDAEFTLAKKLTKYDSEYWVDDYRESLARIALEVREPPKRSHTEMQNWLLANENRLCEILPAFHADAAVAYRNKYAEWINCCSFTHGDQAMITDILDTHEDGTRTVSRHSKYDPSVTQIFSAINHMIYLNESIAMLRGWALGGRGLLVRTARAFENT